MEEYKGIFYNETKEKKSYEGGAHFKYYELYKSLLSLSKTHTKSEPAVTLKKNIGLNHFNTNTNKKMKIIILHKEKLCSVSRTNNKNTQISRNKKRMYISNSCENFSSSGYTGYNKASFNDKIKYQYGSIFNFHQIPFPLQNEKTSIKKSNSLLNLFPEINKQPNILKKIKISRNDSKTKNNNINKKIKLSFNDKKGKRTRNLNFKNFLSNTKTNKNESALFHSYRIFVSQG